jgi:hypothetical protein
LEVPLWILLLAVVSAAAYVALRGIGVALVFVLGIVAIVVAARNPENYVLLGWGVLFVPLLVGAIIMGTISGALARSRRWLLAPLPLLPFAWMPLNAYMHGQDEAEIQRQADAFAAQLQPLERLAGGPVQARRRTMLSSAEHQKDRYEYVFAARNPLYAIVTGTRAASGKMDFKLACVTTLAPGNELTKGRCDVDTVALDAPEWSAQAAASAAGEAVPSLPRIPEGAQVYVIGVHDAQSPMLSEDMQDGVINVDVEAGPTPLVLVLANYRSVKWAVHNAGRPIAAVLVSGFEPATVTGVKQKPVSIGKCFPFESGTPEEKNLSTRVSALVPGAMQRIDASYHWWKYTVRAQMR